MGALFGKGKKEVVDPVKEKPPGDEVGQNKPEEKKRPIASKSVQNRPQKSVQSKSRLQVGNIPAYTPRVSKNSAKSDESAYRVEQPRGVGPQIERKTKLGSTGKGPLKRTKEKGPLNAAKGKEAMKGAKGKGSVEPPLGGTGTESPGGTEDATTTADVSKTPSREPYGENQQKVWIGLPTTRKRRRGQWRVKKVSNSNWNQPSIYAPTKSYCASNYYAHAQQCDINSDVPPTSENN